MVTKQIFHKILSNIEHGALQVTYWDGQTEIYGSGQPCNRITIKTPKALRAMLRNMSLGFGEAYMDGLIEIEGPLTGIVKLMAQNSHLFSKFGLTNVTQLAERNTRTKQASQIERHYDIGNDFYKLWLDKSMTYTCGYYHAKTDSLENAQTQKIDHVLQKLQLSKGHTLLDIGSGWGGLLIKAAKDYGAIGHGVTLSKEQYDFSVTAAQKAQVSDKVTFEYCNYQDLLKRDMRFDRIVSVGMFEAVGRNNLHTYYKVIKKLLVPGGVSVLHTITQEREIRVDPWIDKYIFPGGYAPSYREIIKDFPAYNFRLVDYENLRMHYVLTLREWLRRFETNKDAVIKMYDERFYRMWRLYLSNSISSFEYWDLSLSQIVFTKGLNNDLPLTRDFLYSSK